MKQLLAVLFFSAFISTALAANPMVEIKTNQGSITVELFEKEAPLTVQNFLDYVESGFYNGTIFHRIIDGFMIQGGGFDVNMQQKKGSAPIKNEATNGLPNEPGTLAMARTNDPHSATSQFFINLVNNSSLNQPSGGGWGYAVFGKVTEGFDVVQQIGKRSTRTAGPFQNNPVEPVIIESMTLVSDATAQ